MSTAFKEKLKTSLAYSTSIIGIASSVVSVIGFSLTDISWLGNRIRAFLFLFGCWMFLFWGIFIAVVIAYKKKITLRINGTKVEVFYGDIFASSGIRVIACDSHYDTRIDDIHIEMNSLHGILFRKLNDDRGIKNVVKAKAVALHLTEVQNCPYDFPLGTVIRYESKNDGQVYLLLALTRLDSANKARTTWTEYEKTLAEMWREIDSYYARHDVVLPLLGSGITRFDQPATNEELLKSMLRSFRISGINFNSTLKIVLHDSGKKDSSNKPIQLYQLKHMFD